MPIAFDQQALFYVAFWPLEWGLHWSDERVVNIIGHVKLDSTNSEYRSHETMK